MMMMMSSSTSTTTTNTTNNLPQIQAPIPAPRTPKGREVARSNLENVANSATTTCENNVDQMSAKTTTTSEAVKCNKNDLSRLERILMASRNEDLNLAALISAVEKDIWYMEQLEQNPSVLRRKNRYVA